MLSTTKKWFAVYLGLFEDVITVTCLHQWSLKSRWSLWSLMQAGFTCIMQVQWSHGYKHMINEVENGELLCGTQKGVHDYLVWMPPAKYCLKQFCASFSPGRHFRVKSHASMQNKVYMFERILFLTSQKFYLFLPLVAIHHGTCVQSCNVFSCSREYEAYTYVSSSYDLDRCLLRTSSHFRRRSGEVQIQANLRSR